MQRDGMDFFFYIGLGKNIPEEDTVLDYWNILRKIKRWATYSLRWICSGISLGVCGVKQMIVLTFTPESVKIVFHKAR